MKLLIINGPNINLVGTREPDLYGKKTFEDYFIELQFKFKNVELSRFQSNIEGEIVNEIQAAVGEFEGIILNAAAYTHTSIAIADAVKAIDIPVVEVHISNTFAREAYRHKSYIAPHAEGVIAGFGMQSYELAVQSFLKD